MDQKLKETLEENLEKRKIALQKLRASEELYILLSKCTNMPYVFCEEKNYNDQIFVFTREEDAKKQVEEKAAEDIVLIIVKLEKKQFLPFYSNAYEIGANAIAANIDGELIEVMLTELVTRPDPSELPEGTIRVENPQLHLTVLYYMQELRKHLPEKQEITSEIRSMEEEMISNLKKGTYIIPVKDENKIPFMKFKNGDVYQPVFTDFTEFQKFKKEQNDLHGAIVPFANLLKTVAEQSKGIVINPMGFHLIIMKGQLEHIDT